MIKTITHLFSQNTYTQHWYAKKKHILPSAIPWYSCIAMFICLCITNLSYAQEGTKQFMPNSTDKLYIELNPFASYGANEKERINIHLNTGEKVFFGMKLLDGSGSFRVKDPSGTIVFVETTIPSSGTGYINNYTQAISGPNGVTLNGTTITNGYPSPFSFTAASTGDFYIEFDVNADATLEFFDVTVTNASNNIVTNPDNLNRSAGRLWSKQWAFTTTSFTQFPVNAEFFVFTADEFVNKVKYEMKPFVFQFVANSFGTALIGENVVQQQSQEGDVLSSVDVSEYKIFLNDPDQNAFPTNQIPPPVVKAWLEGSQLFDYNYNRTPQQLDLSANVPTITKNTGSCALPSSATFTIESNVAGKASILIDVNGDGFVVGTNDRALYADVAVGTTHIVWDLKDASGNLLTDGNFTASATFLARGPAHFPLYDVESLNGITTSSIRPYRKLDPTLYWDDSNISNWQDLSGTNAMASTQQKQLVINSTTPRIWTYSGNNGPNNNGNKNTMNSWFNAIDLGLSGFNYKVVTSPTQCNNGALPIVADINKSGPKNVDIPFTVTDFTNKYSDPNNLVLSKIQILSLPTPAQGLLKLSGIAVNVNDEISFANLGNITFTPTTNYTGTFSFLWNGSNGTNYAALPANINIAINTAPSISTIGNQAICTNGNTGPLAFTIGDDETAANALSVTASSNDLDIVPVANIVLGGSGANRTITVTPVTNRAGSATVTVYVSDGVTTSSTSFVIITGPSANFTGSTSACVGRTLSLIAEEIGATSYTWRKGANIVGTSRTFSIGSMGLANEGAYSLTVVSGACTSTKTFDLSVFPKVTFSGNTTVCQGNTLTLTATEPVAGSYSWKKGGVEIGTSQTLTINNMQAANAGINYTLTVVKEGCSNTSGVFTVAVTSSNLTLAVGATSSTICNGNQTNITVANSEPGVNYQLRQGTSNVGTPVPGNSGSINLPTGNLTGTTTFNVLAIKSGCSLQLNNTTTVTVNAPPSTGLPVGAANTSICSGTGANVIVENSENGVSYQLRNGTTDVMAPVAGNGGTINLPTGNLTTNTTFNVLATRTTCTPIALTNQVTISIKATPNIGLTVNTSTTSVCRGGSATITVANSENNVSYSLFNGASQVGNTQTGDGSTLSFTANNLTSNATFSIQATHLLSNCVKTVTTTHNVAVVDAPNAALNVSTDANNICTGANINITVENAENGVSYQVMEGINNVGAPQNGAGNNLTFSINNITSNTNYRIVATNTSSNCSTALNNTVSITVSNFSAVIENGTNVQICGTVGTLTATAIPGATYQWKKEGINVSSKNNQLTVTDAGSYTVTVTVGACSKTSGASMVSLQAIPTSSVAITSDANNATVCTRQNITFTATPTNGGSNPGYQWQINGGNVAGATQSTFTTNTLTSGDAVKVVMTANLACAQPTPSSEVVVTINALPTVTFSGVDVNVENNQVTINEGNSVTINLSGGNTYTWTPNTGISSLSSDGSQAILSPRSTLTYKVIATNVSGCQSSGNDTLQVIVNQGGNIFIPSLFSPNGDGKNDRFVVRGSGFKTIEFRVYDRSGNLIYETKSVDDAMNSGWDGKKNGVNQPIGMYTWSINGTFVNGKKITFKGASAGKINLLR